jgi:sugar phosphate isomerase/epimerase
MFVALNTSLTNNQVQWPEFARLAARIGYGGADFNLGIPMKDGAAATAELYRSLNLRPSFCNLPVNPTAAEDVYRKGMDSLEDATKFVSAIGGHCMMLVVLPSSPTPKNELRALMKERLKPVSDLLGKYNLRLGLEFLGRNTSAPVRLTSSSGEWTRWLRSAGRSAPTWVSSSIHGTGITRVRPQPTL